MKNILTIVLVLFYTTINAQTQEKDWDYVRRFVTVAKTEKQKFGIPVSITLGIALLESESGNSRLVRVANNHFGVKTFSYKVNHVKIDDFKFKKYDNAWESYRDNSLLLMRDHYKYTHMLSKTDYKNWAISLQKSGYSNDKNYAQKLIKIIELRQLWKLDEI